MLYRLGCSRSGLRDCMISESQSAGNLRVSSSNQFKMTFTCLATNSGVFIMTSDSEHYYVGTRRFSSSNQLTTTLIRAAPVSFATG